MVGAGPAYTDRVGATGAAYLLRSAAGSLLLDLGQGSFPRLAAEIDPQSLDGVVISHLHPDHFIDLVPLRHYLCYECQPAGRVTVHGPRALGERLDALYGEPGFSAAALDIVPLSEGLTTVGSFTVEARRVTHTDESYGFRIALGMDGQGLVYSGDCGRADDLRPLIRPGDVLLSEVSFGVGPSPAGVEHLDAGQVGRLAAASGVSRVLLTHLLMGHDRDATVAATARLSGTDVVLVEPGDRFASERPAGAPRYHGRPLHPDRQGASVTDAHAASHATATLRAQARDAVDRAWARAIASGALPALPDDAARPEVEVARPPTRTRRPRRTWP